MDTRKLRDLVSVGPRMADDFRLLGIENVDALAGADPEELYDRMCTISGTRQDPCVLDTYRAAVAQAKDPNLPREQCQWWYWSRLRKSGRLE